MAKGFGTKQLNQAKQKNKKRTPKPLVSINEIQDSLLGYVEEIKDSRVERSQRHKLTDIAACYQKMKQAAMNNNYMSVLNAFFQA